MAATKDLVEWPDHYTRFEIQPAEFSLRNRLTFEQGNIVKYCLRAGRKLYPGMTDLESEIVDYEKVKRYAQMRINQLKGQPIL